MCAACLLHWEQVTLYPFPDLLALMHWCTYGTVALCMLESFSSNLSFCLSIERWIAMCSFSILHDLMQVVCSQRSRNDPWVWCAFLAHFGPQCPAPRNKKSWDILIRLVFLVPSALLQLGSLLSIDDSRLMGSGRYCCSPGVHVQFTTLSCQRKRHGA